MILYEYPLNESVRTMLRLEHLFDRLGQLIVRDAPVDHHFALTTIFEIVEVASRADLKSDLLRELEQHKLRYNGYRGNPAVSEEALDAVTARIDAVFQSLNEASGKAGRELADNEWLASVRNRLGIPGGTCEFDLPAYHAWQRSAPQRRRADLMRWIETLAPLGEALSLLLALVRETGTAHMVAAPQGQYQQSLAPGRPHQLLRVRLDADSELIPEISGHRLMVSVRLMQQEPGGRLKPSSEDATLEITLCP